MFGDFQQAALYHCLITGDDGFAKGVFQCLDGLNRPKISVADINRLSFGAVGGISKIKGVIGVRFPCSTLDSSEPTFAQFATSRYTTS